jgi:uncharacterized protein YbbK (DUF523 family)
VQKNKHRHLAQTLKSFPAIRSIDVIPGDKKVNKNKSPVRPRVGISRCLLGDAVRYDGDSKASTIVLENLSKLFEFVPVCPEVEAGLGIPRPPVRLTASIENPRVTGRDDPDIDVTDIMAEYCQHKPAELESLAGFIFKSRSPSCGLNSTPVFIDNRCVTENSRGVFARSLCASYPDLVVIDDTELEEQKRLDRFIRDVLGKQKS